VARSRPSGLKATAQTAPPWPTQARSPPEATSQTRAGAVLAAGSQQLAAEVEGDGGDRGVVADPGLLSS